MQLFNTPLITDANLFAYYRFESNLIDSSPNGRTLTQVGADFSFISTGGKYGQSGKSTNGNVNFVNANPVNPSSTFSIVGWFNFSAQPPNGNGNFPLFYIAQSNNQTRAWIDYQQIGSTGVYRYHMVWDPTGLGQQEFFFVTTTPLNQYHHVGITFDGGNTNKYILYLDGLAKMTNTVSLRNGNSGSDNEIAILITGLSGNTPASFDDCAFFTRVLNPVEMSLLATDSGGLFLGQY